MKNQLFHLLFAVSFVAGCARHEKTEEAAPLAEPYRYPLTSPGAQFAALPPRVQDTVRAETGSAALTNILKGTNSSGVVYQIFFENSELYPPLTVTQDGQVVNTGPPLSAGGPSETTSVITGRAAANAKPAELPQNVKKAVQERAPRTEIANVTEQTWGNRLIYIVSLKDGRKLYVAEDGIVLNETR